MSAPTSPAGGLSLAMDAFSKKRGLASLNTSVPATDAAADGSAAGQPQPSPLSPLSSATPGSVRTPLSEALAVSAAVPRRKIARHQPAALAQEAESDDSDDDGFAADSMSIRQGGGWTIGVPPHMMTSGAMSLPQHGGFQDMFADGFKPGSVMEGAGRKLRGTDAMRMRNAVLRQTGFLEPEPDNMFADHTAVAAVRPLSAGGR